jgi:DNA-binding SARP family transcriptional activator
MAQLHLALLGPPEVRFGDEVVAFATRKTLALLAYLALEGGAQPRQKLMILLWPDSDENRGRGALRITLVYLRRALDAAVPGGAQIYLHTTGDTLEFNKSAGFTSDTLLLAGSAQSDQTLIQLQQALEACRGPFFESFTLRGAPLFDEWVTFQREHYQVQISLLYGRLTQMQSEKGLLAAGLVSPTAGSPTIRLTRRRIEA